MKRSTSTTDSPRRLLRAPGAATPTLPSTLDQATISPQPTSTQPSIYSKEYLNQLKSSTLSAPPATHRTDYDALTVSKFGDQLDGEHIFHRPLPVVFFDVEADPFRFFPKPFRPRFLPSGPSLKPRSAASGSGAKVAAQAPTASSRLTSGQYSREGRAG